VPKNANLTGMKEKLVTLIPGPHRTFGRKQAHLHLGLLFCARPLILLGRHSGAGSGMAISLVTNTGLMDSVTNWVVLMEMYRELKLNRFL
jgi:hypothetical protein